MHRPESYVFTIYLLYLRCLYIVMATNVVITRSRVRFNFEKSEESKYFVRRKADTNRRRASVQAKTSRHVHISEAVHR